MATCSYRGVRWALRNELTVSSFEKRPLPPSYISYIRSVGAAPSLDGDEAERVLEQAMMCASHRVDGLTCGPTLEGLVSPRRLLGCIDECPKHQFSIRTVRLCGQLARAYPVAGRMLRERLPSLDPASVLTPDTPAQHISGLLTACSAVSFVPQRVLDAALALLASPGGVSALTPRRLALTLRSIVTLVPPDEPASACNTALLADVRRAVRRRLHRGEGRAVAQMSAGHVACTVWFLARTAPAGGAAATEEEEEEEVLALLVARFLETAADVTEESGVGGLSEAAHEDDLLSPKDATMMLWGLRKLGRQDSAPFHRVYRLIYHGVVPVSLMSGVDIALLVHVLCKRRDVIVKVYESGARGVRGNVNVLTHLCNAFVLLLRTCAAPADSGGDAGDADAHGPTVRNLHVVLGGYAHIGLIDGQMPKLLQAAIDAWPRHLCDTGNLHEGAALARHLAALLAARVVAAEALLKMVLLAVPAWVAAAEDGSHKRRAVTSLVRTISGTVARRGVPFCPQHLAALAPLLAHLLRDAKACANAPPLVAALEACAAEGGTRLGGHVAQIFRLLAKVRTVLATSSYTAVAAAAAAAAAAPGAADGGKALREVLGKGCRERFGLVPKGVARGDVPELVRALSSAGQWKRETYGSVAAGVLTTAVAEFAADGGGTPGSAKVRLGRLACVSEAWTLLMGPKRAGKLSPHTVAELHSGSVVILEAAQRALRDAVAEVAEGVAVPLREAVVAMRGTPLCVLSCDTRGPAAVRAVAQVAVAVAERPGASKAELEACMEVVVETLQWRCWYGKRQPEPPELLLSALHSLVDRGRCAVSFRDAVAILKVVHMPERTRRKRRKKKEILQDGLASQGMSRRHLLETVRHRQMAVAAGKRLQTAARRMFERKITPAQAATEGGLFTPTEVHWTLPAATDAAEGPENSATHATNAPPAQFEGLKINECLKIMVRRQRPAAPPAIWTLTSESVAATTLFPIRLAAEDALLVKQQRAQAELDPTFFASASEQAHEQQQESAGPSNGDALPSLTEPPHTLSTVAAVSEGKGGIATT
eukprot:Rhum_TRINITY_DN12914_c0_g1::Rhum_TRINITY_DN12914_c0_g1_i1::g.55432::m.55432